MAEFISAKKAAEKWNISQRRVAVLCSENRVDGAVLVGNSWVIPSHAEKPADKRTTRYKKTDEVALKPFVKWAGGKGQLVSEIEKQMLPTDERLLTNYVEPMVGGGALFFSVLSERRFKQFYISDINSELINAYIAIRDNVERLISRLGDMQNSFLAMGIDGRKNYYYSVRDKFNSTVLNKDSSVEKAAFFIFLNKTCFNGLYRVNRKGQFNVPMGGYKKPSICDSENLRNINAALQNVTIACGDYSQSMPFINGNTFVYLDPPYRPISKTALFNSYNADVFDDAEQIRLAEFFGRVNGLGAKVVLSNSDPKNTDETDNFFDELYGAYSVRRVAVKRMINSRADRRGNINELLIYN